MIGGEDCAATVQAWLARLRAPAAFAIEPMPAREAAHSALAALAAAALTENRSLLIVTTDDNCLADLSNALDLSFRPLCLVLPAADYALAIALRASLSLLKSRLSRDGEANGPVWAAQAKRVAAAADVWRACLAWSAGGPEKRPWPEDLGQLFPVHILPSVLAHNWSATADWVVLVGADGHSRHPLAPWPGATRTLALDGGAAQISGPLVATDAAHRRQGELELLAQELSELELELATAQAEIADFTLRYHDLIGTRMARLDALNAELAGRRAAAHAEDLDASRAADAAWTRARRSHAEQARFKDLAQPTDRPFVPSQDIKKLYRTLAQRIHPDRARNERDRGWRTQLMTEANRAYRANDRKALDEIFSLWAEGHHGDSTDCNDFDGLNRQTMQLKRRIGEIETELNRLFASKLYELFTAANIASRAGRDLLQEMADRLAADVAAAEAQLAA